MTKFIQYILVTASFLIIISCVGQKPFAFNDTQQPTDFGGGGGNDCGINSALVVSAVAAPQPAVLSNGTVAVTITVTAYGYCDKYQMTSPSQAPTTTFTRTQTFQKNYTAAGSFQETIGVNALNNSNAVVDHKDIILTVVVQDNTPPNDPNPTCAIERRGSVADTNALAPVALTATGTIVSSTMGNPPVNVVLGQTYGLLPVSPGLYNGVGKVVDNKGREANCSLSLVSPTTEIQALSTTYNSVKLQMVLHGPISVGGVKIDGVVQSLPSNGNIIIYNKPHTAGPGKYTSLGEVINFLSGDRGTGVTPQYCIPHPPLTNSDIWTSNYYLGNGFTGTSNLRAYAGIQLLYCDSIVNNSCWRVKSLEREFNTQIRIAQTTTVNNPNLCPTDFAMIGHGTAVSGGATSTVCGKLYDSGTGARIKLVNTVSKTSGIYDNVVIACNAGQVQVGKNSVLVGGSWQYTIWCATPVWEECQ